MIDLYVRKARMQDVKTIHSLLMERAKLHELLPRSFSELYSHLRDFFVLADKNGPEVYGCCALSITWEDLAEVRSLVVDTSARNGGWGRRLLEACLSEAVTLGIYRVFTLTYIPDFFAKQGFRLVEKDVLPQKVWADCIHCVKFPECDEIAMLMDL